MQVDSVSATPVAAPAPARNPSTYIPAFDGLRGFALCAVLLYHGGYSWLPGGFFSVSTFFTLSGFLITRLMLQEIQKKGRLAIGAFYLRRARRLLPAAILTLGFIVVFRSKFGAISPERLRGDVVAGLAYGENWWLIHTDQAYGAIFATGSPVQHFWSLAIEEQYYVVFPLLFWGLYRFLRKPVVVFGALVTMTVASLGVAAWLSSDLTRTYYGTDTRAAEILFGVLLAYAVARFDRAERSPSTRTTIEVLAFVGLVGTVVLWLSVDLHDTFVFRGGTLLNGLFTAAIIVAGLQRGVVTRFLSLAPWRLLGSISYGIYLLHWPIFVILNPSRLGLSLLPTFVVRLAVTITIAVLLYVLIENPVRRGRMFKGAIFFVVVAIGSAAVLGLAVTMRDSGAQTIDLAAAGPVAGQLDALAKTPAVAGDARVLLVGDSMGWSVSVGLTDWGRQHHLQVGRYTALGCGIGGPGTLEYLGLVRPTFPDCADWQQLMSTAVKDFKPDVALVVVGLADISPRRFPDGKFRSIGDRSYDARLTAKVQKMARTLTSTGARLEWATFPHVNIPYNAGGTGTPPFVENDPQRIDQLNALVGAALKSIPNASLVDFAGYSQSRPGGELDHDYRPDGAHLSVRGTADVANWLGPKLLR